MSRSRLIKGTACLKRTEAHRFLTPLIGAMATLFCSASALAQCAMCRASLANSRGDSELIEGLRQGSVLLLAVPLAIAATLLLRLKRAANQGNAPALQTSVRGESVGGTRAEHL
jgi:hypothetical protein